MPGRATRGKDILKLLLSSISQAIKGYGYTITIVENISNRIIITFIQDALYT
jgi:hypothetical protein